MSFKDDRGDQRDRAAVAQGAVAAAAAEAEAEAAWAAMPVDKGGGRTGPA